MLKLKVFIIQINNKYFILFPNINQYTEDFNYNVRYATGCKSDKK